MRRTTMTPRLQSLANFFQSNTKNNRRIGRLFTFVLFLPMLFTIVVSAETAAVSIGNTRDVLDKWVETQRVISREKRDLELAKEMLKERIDLVKREIASLREKISDAEKSISEADTKRAGMIDENEKLKTVSSSMGNLCQRLEDHAKSLLARLPDPIRDHVKPLSQQIPKDREEIKVSTSIRYQNIVGILNAIDKFNQNITVESEVRPLPDATSAEVTALYLGIGQGFYTGVNGTIAGIGTATEEGWIWTPANEAAAAITRVIGILKNEQVASFVFLPIDVR